MCSSDLVALVIGMPFTVKLASCAAADWDMAGGAGLGVAELKDSKPDNAASPETVMLLTPLLAPAASAVMTRR